MPYFEEEEFYDLIGDQLVTLGKTKHDLLNEASIELTIDGHKLKFPRIKAAVDPNGKRIATGWNTIYNAVQHFYCIERKEKNPIHVLCHQDHMTPAGVCRVCLVNVKTGRGAKLAPACRRRIEPGMEIETIRSNPDAILPTVKMVVELLVSDYHRPEGANLAFGEKGENELLRIAEELGVSTSAYRLPRGKATRPRDDTSLLIRVDHNACILCDRCVRGCNEVRKNFVLGRARKGYAARIAFDLDDPMGESNCVTCGECMVSCPTGALALREQKSEVGGQQSGGRTSDLRPLNSAPEPVSPQELSELPLFAGISRPFLAWNENAVVRRRFCKGDVVCREGEYGSTAFIMEKGRFEVSIKSPLSAVKKQARSGISGFLGRFAVGLGGAADSAGTTADSGQQFIPVDAPVSLQRGRPVAVLDPSDLLFGEMTCMSHYPRAATVTALEDCSVLEIQSNVLYMLQRSTVSRKLLDDVYRRRTLDTHLRSFNLFTDLLPDPEQFKTFAEFLRPKVQLVRVHPGQVIIRQGDKADYFYMVRSGFVKVTQTRQGVARVVNYLGPGMHFGEIGVLGQLLMEERAGKMRDEGSEMIDEGLHPSSLIPHPSSHMPGVRTATCSALDHVDLVRMNQETFLDLIEMFPQLRQSVLEVALQRLESDERLWKEINEVPLPDFLEQGLAGAGNVLVLDLERCTRCDECTKACADSHGGVTRLIREGLRFGHFLVASSCRSCLDPYCLVGCPVAAIERTAKGDINIKETCIGCGNCANNCPYGNINMVGFDKGETTDDPHRPGHRIAVRTQKATTCDKCNGIDPPSCVYACPHEAAHRMDGKELLNLVKQRNAGR